MSLCDDCILNGRCDGRCGDTDPTYYDFEAETTATTNTNEKVTATIATLRMTTKRWTRKNSSKNIYKTRRITNER